ncbi:hypothetical protein PF004_g7255 [Phytophthora fragariae]|uniref:leucine--tRNA ligase n=1 Tax=Phytophthora fragariae TaxID=53985 RepID=A0A6G0PAM9_9STRA|nr:hypothetical protein PF004_g7255 [Phytophthora fragariae]
MSKDDRGKGDTTAGVFTGLYACHPLSGRHVPIYLAEYVLTHYGTGVVMGAPAHDSRDLAFAHHHNQESMECCATAENHGVDVTRLVVLFKAPPAHELESVANEEEEKELRHGMHGAIKRVTEALDDYQSFNAAISELLKLSKSVARSCRALPHTRRLCGR